MKIINIFPIHTFLLSDFKMHEDIEVHTDELYSHRVKMILWIHFLTRFKDALGNGKLDYPETNREVTPFNDVPNLTLHEDEYRLQILF